MNILILNGSPRPNGNTAAMVRAYASGAAEAGHTIHIVDVCKKKIGGCLACEYCPIPRATENASNKMICKRSTHCWKKRK